MGKLIDRKEDWKYNAKKKAFEIEIVTKREMSLEEAVESYKKNKDLLKGLKDTLAYYKWFYALVNRAFSSAPEKLKGRLSDELSNMEMAIKDLEENIKMKKEAVSIFKKYEKLLKKAEKERDSKTIG